MARASRLSRPRERTVNPRGLLRRMTRLPRPATGMPVSFRKGRARNRLCFTDHPLMENPNSLSIGPVAKRAPGRAERLTALRLIGPLPITHGNEKGCDTDEFYHRLGEIVEPVCPIPTAALGDRDPTSGHSRIPGLPADSQNVRKIPAGPSQWPGGATNLLPMRIRPNWAAAKEAVSGLGRPE
jgi:hypothetical protein